ncbi:universal stress protein [Planosporangium sp. 12N6]|uniref:universal stress protein n=1 Tax=Planosporangium spinosum TaxID=3402278 RepID=UPI003CF4D22C
MPTTPETPIVVGVDDSPSASHALDWAAAEAGRRHLPLRLVHVVEWQPYGPCPPEPPADTGQTVARARDRVLAAAPDLTVTTSTCQGDAAGALVAESVRAAMVVVGSRGLGGFRGLLVGSVSIQTAAHARCPVVVVRPPAPVPADRDVGRPEPERGGADDHDTEHHGAEHPGGGPVVVGVDGSSLSDMAVTFAFEEAALRGVGVTAVHAWQVPSAASPIDLALAAYQRIDLTDIERKLLTDSLAEQEKRHPEVPVRRLLRQGNAAALLVRESVGAQLLVVGSRGYGGFTGLLLGSVSDAALRHAECPVAVVR